MTTPPSTVPLAPDPQRIRIRDAVLDQLWLRFPAHCVVLTDPRCRPAVELGLDRAARHGFHALELARPFVVLMMLLGSHFDEDPQLPWAGERLRRSALAPRRHAMADLLAGASEAMEPVVGREGEYYRRALGRIGALELDTLVQTYAGDDEGLRRFVRHIYRRKHDALGPDGVTRLLQWAQFKALHHGLSTPSGALVMVGLMLMLGTEVDRDPFHPWVGDTLAATRGEAPEARARSLHQAASWILTRHARLDGLNRPHSTEA